MDILSALGGFNDIFVCNNMLKRLSNVLLHGLHKLEKDHQKNLRLMQTSVKKARMARLVSCCFFQSECFGQC